MEDGLPSQPVPRDLRLFTGGGEMGEQVRALDWSSTPIGRIEEWPPSLLTLVTICLRSSSPIAIFWDSQHWTLFYNDAYISVLGKEKHPGWLGRSAQECWKDIWPIIGPAIDEVFATGQPASSENLLLVMDRNLAQEETYFTFSFSAIPRENGSVAGIFCICTETTCQVIGQRRAQIASNLRPTTEARTVEDVYVRAAQVLEAHPQDVPFALLYKLNIQTGIASLASSAGLEGEKLLNPAQILLSDETACWPLKKVMDTNTIQVVTELGPRWGERTIQAGRKLPPQTALVLPVTGQGQAHPSTILVAGISSQQILDKDYWGFFELLVSHLARALVSANFHEEDLHRAASLAEFNRSKTVFFRNVSHEFRAPLTLILGPLEDLLATDTLPPTLHSQVEGILRNGVRLLKQVNTLLDFSLIEAGRIEAVFVPTDLAALTTDLASVFRSLIEKVGLQLRIDCPPLSEPVYVDREMWEKIVLNLLSNALKFTFAGEISVSLNQEGKQVGLVVRDSGIGIAPEDVSRLIAHFHPALEGRERTNERPGIGLALVQELVHLHGGTIRVESQLGKGTAMIIHLPLGTAHLPTDHIYARQTLDTKARGTVPFVEEAGRFLSESVPGDSRVVSGMRRDATGEQASVESVGRAKEKAGRILLAEDNADLRQYVTDILSERYQVVTVFDGGAALAEAKAHPPDLVLADVMMPGLDGIELLRSLQANSRLRAIPVVLLSDRVGEESTIEDLQVGADDYLIKPFSAREVLARVAAQIAMTRLHQEIQRETEAIEQRVVERTAELACANAALLRQVDERVSTEEQLRQLSRRVLEVQEAERRRIARELHDEVGQALTGVKMLLDQAGERAEERTRLEEARNAIDEVLDQVRELSLELRPAMLDTLGLVPAVLWHLKRFTKQTGIEVKFRQINRIQRYAPEFETVVYRLLQEALTNIARHAGVHHASVQLQLKRSALTLRIEDQGRGFEVKAELLSGTSTGLAGMRERVALLEGTLDIQSSPGTGTILVATLPLRRNSGGGHSRMPRKSKRDH